MDDSGQAEVDEFLAGKRTSANPRAVGNYGLSATSTYILAYIQTVKIITTGYDYDLNCSLARMPGSIQVSLCAS